MRKKKLQKKPKTNREQEFWNLPEKIGGCWLWTRWLDRDGYGEFRFNGKKWKAHRLAYYLYYGTITKGLQILHSCDTPSCVNPSHLSEGTNQENVNDMVSKKRHEFGSKRYNAKLKEEDILKILDLIKNNVPQTKIAKMFEVSTALISGIKNQKMWKHTI